MNERLSDPTEPTLGRFINRDPIGFAGGLNMHTYGANSPVNLLDAAGLEPYSLPSIHDKLLEPEGPKIIPREKWQANPPIEERLQPMEGPGGPIRRITIHHPGRSGILSNVMQSTSDSAIMVHYLQWEAQSDSGGDIQYNYVIAPSGAIFEGRSLEYFPAHTAQYNGGNIGIVMLGYFDTEYGFTKEPNPAAKKSLAALILYLSEKYGIPLDQVKTHQRVNVGETDCPGRNFERKFDLFMKDLTNRSR